MSSCNHRSLVGNCSSGSDDCSGTRRANDCCPRWTFLGDPCYPGLCCDTRPKVTYRPFIPSYERGGHYQRVWWYSEKNTWQVWKTPCVPSSQCN